MFEAKKKKNKINWKNATEYIHKIGKQNTQTQSLYLSFSVSSRKLGQHIAYDGLDGLNCTYFILLFMQMHDAKMKKPQIRR